MSRILVTGGAGYIGSHVVKLLRDADSLIVVDNLYKGFPEAVLHGELTIGDSGDRTLMMELLQKHRIDTVMHFAAHTVVPESVSDPLKYYANNTCATRNLIECCVSSGVENFIFSSTAAVYGIPESGVADEATMTAPINPYGSSKLMSEMMLRDACSAADMKYAILRYFNVAGCDPDNQIGQSTPDATLLIKVACEAAVGTREELAIFGTDYPTPDGTGVRDYIHVMDLAQAHLDALSHLQQGGESLLVNCGYGHGYSVQEVLDTVQRVSGKSLRIRRAPRRAGDPPSLIANAEKIKQTLGWKPLFDNLDEIVASAYAWEQKLARGEGYARR